MLSREGLGEMHETLFARLFMLTGPDVVGAFFHQFVLKDGPIERTRRPG